MPENEETVDYQEPEEPSEAEVRGDIETEAQKPKPEEAPVRPPKVRGALDSCHIQGCSGLVKHRTHYGLCPNCYGDACGLIHQGLTDWGDLVRRGKALPIEEREDPHATRASKWMLEGQEESDKPVPTPPEPAAEEPVAAEPPPVPAAPRPALPPAEDVTDPGVM